MSEPAKVVAARAEVDRARAQLIDTAREIQARLQPKTLAREAWDNVKDKGADLAEDAVDAVKRRPVATGGVIAGLAMLLAREPIKDGIVRAYDAMTSKKKSRAARSAPAASPTKPSPARKPAKRRPARRAAAEKTEKTR